MDCGPWVLAGIGPGSTIPRRYGISRTQQADAGPLSSQPSAYGQSVHRMRHARAIGLALRRVRPQPQACNWITRRQAAPTPYGWRHRV